ncbi:ectoine/hydroxyectoine ABC transporter substrate-binding protein EhuB [Variovorax sp. GB1R11]|uniref:ectoine/hydroxyectoine ABC transporter substrate-binding protein EhuB n=1 Tax=Variovorax sp. GB1R11 TaxID=3443741 RepID=UPI003F485BE0
MLKFIAVALAAFLSLSPSLTAAQAQPQVKEKMSVGLAHEPPYTNYQAGGTLSGAAPDLLFRIMKDFGVKELDPKVLEFGAMIPSLQAGRVDVISTGLYINPQRCKAVLFSEPDLCTTEGFIVAKGNPKAIKSFADVAANESVRYGVCGGCSAEKRATESGVPRSRITVAPDHQSGIKMLLDGRIDVYAAPDLALRSAATSMGVMDRFEVLVVANEPAKCSGIAFRTDQKGLRDMVDQKLKALKDSGEYDQIVSKYGFDPKLAKATSRTTLCGGAN